MDASIIFVPIFFAVFFGILAAYGVIFLVNVLSRFALWFYARVSHEIKLRKAADNFSKKSESST